MKKIIFIFLSVFLMSPALFSQSKSNVNVNVNVEKQGINIRFGNRKTKGYFNTTQIQLLMGNQLVNQPVYSYPYYPPYQYFLDYAPVASNLVYDYYYPYYFNITRTELQISPSVTMTNGYMFNERWAAGIGVGFEIFDRNMVPVFADIRYTLWDNKVSPYFAMKGGYAFSDFKTKHYDNLNLNYEPYSISGADFRCYGGLLLNPEMGVKVPLNGNADLLFTVAYRYQKIKSVVRQSSVYDYIYSSYSSGSFNEWTHKENLNRLSFGVAVMFR